MARKALPPDEADRVREIVRDLLRGVSRQQDLAARTGVRQQIISSIVNGGPVSYPVARKIVDFVGADFDAVVKGRTPTPVAGPTLSSLPGWAEAETEARRRFPGLPERAWAAVASGRHAIAPARITPEWIGQLVFAWSQALPQEPTGGKP